MTKAEDLLLQIHYQLTLSRHNNTLPNINYIPGNHILTFAKARGYISKPVHFYGYNHELSESCRDNSWEPRMVKYLGTGVGAEGP